MFERKNIVHAIQDGQYVRVTNESGSEIILPIALFQQAGDISELIARINTLSSSKNIALAAGTIRPTFTTAGEPITWAFLAPEADQSHDKLYFSGTVTASTNTIDVQFPDSVKVITGMVTIDDSLVSKKVSFGPAMGTNSMQIVCGYSSGFGAYINNNGVEWDVINLGSGGTNATLAYNPVNGVLTISNLPYVTPTYNYNFNFGVTDPSLTVDAHIREVFAGLAVGQQKVQLVTGAGVPITGAPDPAWVIKIGGEETTKPLICDVLGTENQYIWETLSNLWLYAILEV